MLYYVCCSVLLLSFSILFYRYKKNNKKYIDKIAQLKLKLRTNSNKKTLNMYSYHMIFKIINELYLRFEPQSISLYLYNTKKELNTTNLDFLYQIKDDGYEPSTIFTDKYNNIPITNINIITNMYFSHNVLAINVLSELDGYDRGLYEKLLKNDIKSLYLLNVYNCDTCEHMEKDCIKNKPIGFFSLTYKDKILSEEELVILKKETERISEHLINIIQ